MLIAISFMVILIFSVVCFLFGRSFQKDEIKKRLLEMKKGEYDRKTGKFVIIDYELSYIINGNDK